MDYETYQVRVWENGDKEWRQNGELNRLDGPALEFINGDKEWYKNGEFHRLDGPAIDGENCDRYWFQNGLLHRVDGPAIEHFSGLKVWYVNGKQLTEKEFNQLNQTYLSVLMGKI